MMVLGETYAEALEREAIYHHRYEPYWDYAQFQKFHIKYFGNRGRLRWWFDRVRWLFIRPFVLHHYRHWKRSMPPVWNP